MKSNSAAWNIQFLRCKSRVMRFKILVSLIVLIVVSAICWLTVGQSIYLTALHGQELQPALVSYWEVTLSSQSYDDPALLATVATGELLDELIRGRQLTQARPSVSTPLESAKILQVIEYMPSCSLVKAEVFYAGIHRGSPNSTHYHLFLKEDGRWKVAYLFNPIPLNDWTPLPGPQKSCADFVK